MPRFAVFLLLTTSIPCLVNMMPLFLIELMHGHPYLGIVTKSGDNAPSTTSSG